jgi:hypothetical protein
VDASGNIYAAGSQSGTGSHTYGNGVSAAGTAPDANNAILVKYNSSGDAQWAKTVSSGSGSSRFYSVAVDASGNIYAAGFQDGTGYNLWGTVILVKYNSSGDVQWAKTVSSGSDRSVFNSVAVDASGNIYAAGFQIGLDSYTYGNGVSAKGTVNYVTNSARSARYVVLVKYNSSGDALWAKTVSFGSLDFSSPESSFNSVAVDASGNIYAAGFQHSTGSYTYGNGVSARGTASSSIKSNVVLVKYNSSGDAQWAKTVSSGSDHSLFKSVAVDTSGNIYVAGSQFGTGSCTYGSGISATGTASYGYTGVLVKYNSSGEAQWAKTVSAGSSSSPSFNSVAVDASGNIYTACQFFLAKYNSSGNSQWTKTGDHTPVSGGGSSFNSVAVDTSGNIYAAGSQYGTGSYTYGSGISAAGAASDANNAVLVKYR